MSDLSQLLGDLYAAPVPPAHTGGPVAPAAGSPARAPSWSSDEALDAVFASWVPGPDDAAPAAERSVVAAVTDVPSVDAPDAAWLHDTAPVAAGFEPEAEPAGCDGERFAAAIRWSPADDDILPPRRARGRKTWRFRLR
jgi:hypothetical protein